MESRRNCDSNTKYAELPKHEALENNDDSGTRARQTAGGDRELVLPENTQSVLTMVM